MWGSIARRLPATRLLSAMQPLAGMRMSAVRGATVVARPALVPVRAQQPAAWSRAMHASTRAPAAAADDEPTVDIASVPGRLRPFAQYLRRGDMLGAALWLRSNTHDVPVDLVHLYVEMCWKRGLDEQALAVLRDPAAVHASLQAITYNVCIKHSLEKEDVERALLPIEAMHEAGVKMTRPTFHMLLRAGVDLRRPDLSRRAYEWMFSEESKFGGDAYSHNLMLRALVSSRDWASVVDVFRVMERAVSDDGASSMERSNRHRTMNALLRAERYEELRACFDLCWRDGTRAVDEECAKLGVIAVSRVGSLDDTCALLAELRKANVATSAMYGVAMHRAMKDRKPDVALELHDTSLELGPATGTEINNTERIRALAALGRVDELVDFVCQPAMVVNTRSFNVAMQACWQHDAQDKAEQLWKLLGTNPRKSVALSVVSYNIMIKGYTDVGNTTKALSLWDAMLASGMMPTHVSIVTVMNTMTESGQPMHAVEMFHAMKRRFGIEPNLVHHACLIKAWGELNRVSELIDVEHKLRRRYGSETVDQAVGAALMSAYAQCDEDARAQDILERVMSSGLRPSLMQYGVVMSSMGRLGLLDDMWRAVRQARHDFPDATAVDKFVSMYMDACVECGAIDRATAVYRQIRSGTSRVWGGGHAAFPYTIMIRAYQMQSRYRDALKVVRAMRADGVPLVPVTYFRIMEVYAEQGDVAAAERTFLDMQANGGEPTGASFNILMRAYTKAGNLEEALRVIDRMKEAGLEPTVANYNSMLDACATCGDWTRGLEVFAMMRESSTLVPDAATYACVIRGFGTVRDTDGLRGTLDLMASDGVVATVATYSVGVAAALKCGDAVLASELVVRGLREAQLPSDVFFTKVLIRLRERKDAKGCLHVLRVMRDEHVQATRLGMNNALQACFAAEDVCAVQRVEEELARVFVTPDLMTVKTLVHGYLFLRRGDDAARWVDRFEQLLDDDMEEEFEWVALQRKKLRLLCA